MGKISVVITVFNDEKFLDTSVRSIQNQTYRDWELILVDDGSTDRSGEICDEYVGKDDRIRVVHQQNLGYSGARNTGLELVTGDYVMFVDSDDWIEPDALRAAYDGIVREEADYAIGGVNFIYYTDESRKTVDHIDTGVPESAYSFHMKNLAVEGKKLWNICGPMFYCVWSRLFKMEIIRNYHLRFNTSLKLQEDVNFTFCYMYHTDKVFVSNRVFYNYCREIDKDDTAEKPILEQYFYVEESLLNIDRIVYKFRLPEAYRIELYHKLSDWFLKLAGKIYMESTGLTDQEQRLHTACMSDSYIFRVFCEKFSERDTFWARMKTYLDNGNMEDLYIDFGEKLKEGVIPPCQ